MTEFITRNYGNENFEIIIKTDSKEHYKATENFARWLIDHTKHTFTIEAKPVVHAHWEIEYDDDDNIKKCYCSNCGVGCEPMNYCGFCGAQMDELVSNTDELNNTQKVSVDDVEIP